MIGIQRKSTFQRVMSSLLVLGFGGYLRDRKTSSKQLIIKVWNAVVSGRKLAWHVKIQFLIQQVFIGYLYVSY